MSNPRITAVKLLTKFEKNSSYSALALSDELKKINFSDSRDKAFAVSLIYGVLEHKITLDYNISLYLVSKLSKLKIEVLNILRVGAYQLLYMDKIPKSAAVNEAVNSSKKMGLSFSSGLINAVLHKIANKGLILPDEENTADYLSVLYSADKSILSSVISDFGIEKTKEIFSVFSGRRPIYIRHNSLKCSEEQLCESLKKDGVEVTSASLDGCFCINNTGDIAELAAYKNGWFHVQDMSSQLCCKLLDVRPGDTVVDCCAAPGGKSFTLAQYLCGSGSILSCDMYEHKTKLIENGAKRLGINNLKAVCSDARELYKQGLNADKVLCDVPCSGFGVIGRKPEIRYKTMDELSELPIIQKEILYSCAKMVKSGGTLIYSTCTLNKAENDAVCDSFLSDFPDFSIASQGEYSELTDKYLTVFPEALGGDGFFIAKFIRG